MLEQGRYYLEKRRDTFHYRNALKRLGLKFDGEKRIWYAETPEALEAAKKLLDGVEPKGELPVPPLTVPSSGKPEQCGECGYTGGEHSSKCTQQGTEGTEGSAEQQGSASGEGSPEQEGEGEGESSSSSSGGGPGPFTVYVQSSMQMPPAQAAQMADAVLQQALASQQQTKQQQQQMQKQQEQMRQEQQKQQQRLEQQMQEKLAEQQRKLDSMAEQQPQKIVVQVGEQEPVELPGKQFVVQEYLSKIVAWLKIGLHVRLVGPAGSGKSMLAKQAAEALGRRFGFVNFSEGAREADLFGFRDITDKGTHYIVPELSYADLYENGGIWLGDEYDRADSNMIVSLNGSLANGHLSLPKRQGATIATKHDDFGCIVTMNTWGTGPNSNYTSANKLDASSLDRFKISTLYIDYNRQLERSLMPDAELLQKIWAVRDKVMALGLQRVVSTRFIADAAKCQKLLGWQHSDVMQQLLLDWSPTDRQKVEA